MNKSDLIRKAKEAGNYTEEELSKVTNIDVDLINSQCELLREDPEREDKRKMERKYKMLARGYPTLFNSICEDPKFDYSMLLKMFIQIKEMQAGRVSRFDASARIGEYLKRRSNQDQ